MKTWNCNKIILLVALSLLILMTVVSKIEVNSHPTELFTEAEFNELFYSATMDPPEIGGPNNPRVKRQRVSIQSCVRCSRCRKSRTCTRSGSCC